MGLGKWIEPVFLSFLQHSLSSVRFTGKTIQALAFLSAIIPSRESFRVLIVVPASVRLERCCFARRLSVLSGGMAVMCLFVVLFQVMEQWAREARWWGVTRLFTYAGPKRSAFSTCFYYLLPSPFWLVWRQTFSSTALAPVKEGGKYRGIVTSYATFLSDLKEINGVMWSCAIFDGRRCSI
jgi:hypothetical protein